MGGFIELATSSDSIQVHPSVQLVGKTGAVRRFFENPCCFAGFES
jgi:hypothetical protein